MKLTGTRRQDEIDGKIMRIFAHVITKTLTYIKDLCIDKSRFPSQFKRAEVIPLFKSGDPSQPSNHKSISILPVI